MEFYCGFSEQVTIFKREDNVRNCIALPGNGHLVSKTVTKPQWAVRFCCAQYLLILPQLKTSF